LAWAGLRTLGDLTVHPERLVDVSGRAQYRAMGPIVAATHAAVLAAGTPDPKFDFATLVAAPRGQTLDKGMDLLNTRDPASFLAVNMDPTRTPGYQFRVNFASGQRNSLTQAPLDFRVTNDEVHIRQEVHLAFDADVTEEFKETVRGRIEVAVTGLLDNHFVLMDNLGHQRYRVRVDVGFRDQPDPNNESIRVSSGMGRANTGQFYAEDPRLSTYAHEFGHRIFGAPDEYPDQDDPTRPLRLRKYPVFVPNMMSVNTDRANFLPSHGALVSKIMSALTGEHYSIALARPLVAQE
jgi:hypothetical protein